MNILLIRISALGDLVHALPAVSDIRRAVPDARIDVAVDERFADVPGLHPGIDKVFALPLARWKASWRSRATWSEFLARMRDLRGERYDLVIDLHGVIKSAAIAAIARGRDTVGLGPAHCGEWMAPLAYRRRFSPPDAPPPVARMRRLVGFALDETPQSRADFGLGCGWSGQDSRQVVLVHLTSRAEKCWADGNWIALGETLVAAGWEVVLPWGSQEEKARAERLARSIDPSRCVVGRKQSVREWAWQLSTSRMVIGLDTGFTHLAAAAGVPCLALFTTTDPVLFVPQNAALARVLGGNGVEPTRDEVCRSALEMLATAPPRSTDASRAPLDGRRLAVGD